MPFELIKGEGHSESIDAKWWRLNRLVEKYECKWEDEPQWCICGKGPGYRIEGVVVRVRPCEEDRMIANQIAQVMNELGGEVAVEMTHFNPNLKGEPYYKKYDPQKFLDSILEQGE